MRSFSNTILLIINNLWQPISLLESSIYSTKLAATGLEDFSPLDLGKSRLIHRWEMGFIVTGFAFMSVERAAEPGCLVT